MPQAEAPLQHPPLVWVLADDRAGDVAQAMGVAEALGLPFEVKEVRYDHLARLPNWLKGASFTGLDAATRARLTPPWPNIVISAGRRTVPLVRWLKQRHGAFTVQLMWPGGMTDIDLLATPRHDLRIPDHPHLMRIPGAPHRVTPERLAAEAERWRPKVMDYPRPWILLSIGGATVRRDFSVDQARELAEHAGTLARASGGTLLVTTSRRTPPEVEQVLTALLPSPRMLYTWRQGGENPYYGWLGLADAVVVTGESVSMLCEACATQVPVFIFAPEGWVVPKHQRLHRDLYAEGYARPLNGGRVALDWSHPPLNAAPTIAAEIRRRLELQD